MKLINSIKQLLHIHDWGIIKQGDYDLYYNNPKILKNNQNTAHFRRCQICKKKQVLVIECLRLKPPKYYQYWENIE